MFALTQTISKWDNEKGNLINDLNTPNFPVFNPIHYLMVVQAKYGYILHTVCMQYTIWKYYSSDIVVGKTIMEFS